MSVCSNEVYDGQDGVLIYGHLSAPKRWHSGLFSVAKRHVEQCSSSQ